MRRSAISSMLDMIRKTVRRWPVLVLGMGLLLAIWTSACGSPSASQWFAGNTLTMRVLDRKTVAEVRYVDGDTHYVIRPSNTNGTLMVFQMEVRNQGSNRVVLGLTKDAVKLRDDQFQEYQPLDPLVERGEVAVEGPREGQFTPFLWGDQELPKDYQVTGWFVFEVPRGAKAREIVWNAADIVYVKF